MENNTEQQGDLDLIQKTNLKRTRVTAIIFGVLAGLSLVCLVYAFVQQNVYKEQMKGTVRVTRLADSLQTQLNKCAEEAMRQQKIAEMNAIEANMQHQRAEEALKKFSKK